MKSFHSNADSDNPLGHQIHEADELEQGAQEDQGATIELTGHSIPERHPDWPPLAVTFWFSGHDTYQDMEGLAPYLADKDLYFYEGRSDQITDVLQYFANNLFETDEVERWMNAQSIGERPLVGSALEAQLRAVIGTGVVVGSFDVTGKDLEDARAPFFNVGPLPKGESNEDALANYTELEVQRAEAQNQREARMIPNFEQEVGKILTEHPDLKGKSPLNILISMGSYHTTLGHLFGEHGVPSEHYFSGGTPYTHDYRNELRRTFAFGKVPSEELIQRSYVESLIGGGFESVSGVPLREMSAEDQMRYLRGFVSRLSTDQLSKLISLYRQDTETLDEYDAILAQSGQRFPRSIQDLREQSE